MQMLSLVYCVRFAGCSLREASAITNSLCSIAECCTVLKLVWFRLIVIVLIHN